MKRRAWYTFMYKHYVDLKDYNISQAEAAELRARLLPFTQEWDAPEMDLYDEYDRIKSELGATGTTGADKSIFREGRST